MTARSPASPHELIHADILTGLWKPGAKLQPSVLAERYGTSTTVVREALRHLAGEGVVTAAPNRGFFLPQLSLDELRDLTEVRCRNEGLAIEFAIARGDLAWESDLIAAHHRLAQTPRTDTDSQAAWRDAHQEFHAMLISAAGVPTLTDFCRHLSLRTELYRRWAADSADARNRDVEREHREILEATLARDTERAARLLAEHYRRSVDVVLRSGFAKELAAGS